MSAAGVVGCVGVFVWLCLSAVMLMAGAGLFVLWLFVSFGLLCCAAVWSALRF